MKTIVVSSILISLFASLGCASTRNSFETACVVAQKHKWEDYENKERAVEAYAGKLENAAPDSPAAISMRALTGFVPDESTSRYDMFEYAAKDSGAENFQCVELEKNL